MGCRATASPSTPPAPGGATSTPATAPLARTSPHQQGSLPTPGPTRPAPPPPSAPTSALQLWLLPPLLSPLPLTTTSTCQLLLSPPPSRSLLPMCPSSTTTTTTSTSLPLSSSPTIPTPTLTGTRSPRAPIWPPSPRRQTPPSRRLTLPSQPSREISIFVLWGHYYQIKARKYL